MPARQSPNTPARLFERHIADAVREALTDTPVVCLRGPRQSGKTTLAQHLANGSPPRAYVTLDDDATRAAAQADPVGFLAGLPGPTTIDEVQRAPELALALKAAVDADRRPGRFLLTGSAGGPLWAPFAEALVGRMETHTLWPLSQGEMAGVRETFVERAFAADLSAIGAQQPSGPPPQVSLEPETPRQLLATRLCAGGFPEAVARKARRRHAWFDAYVEGITQRDIRDLASIVRGPELSRLLAMLASRASQPVNFADLSRSLSIPQTSLKRYVALFEATFLIRFLPAWTANIGKRLVKAPKLIFNDLGLLAHLLATDPDRLDANPTLFGPALENLVAAELGKQLGWSAKQCRLHHFRTHSGIEVDLVLESSAGDIVGIEVKAGASLRPSAARGLRTLAGFAGKQFACGIILYAGTASVPFGNRIRALPIDALWA